MQHICVLHPLVVVVVVVQLCNYVVQISQGIACFDYGYTMQQTETTFVIYISLGDSDALQHRICSLQYTSDVN